MSMSLLSPSPVSPTSPTNKPRGSFSFSAGSNYPEDTSQTQEGSLESDQDVFVQEKIKLSKSQKLRQEYDGTKQYIYAKRGQVLLASRLAQLHPWLTVVSAHPGWVDTPGIAQLGLSLSISLSLSNLALKESEPLDNPNNPNNS